MKYKYISVIYDYDFAMPVNDFNGTLYVHIIFYSYRESTGHLTEEITTQTLAGSEKTTQTSADSVETDSKTELSQEELYRFENIYYIIGFLYFWNFWKLDR